MNSLKPSWYLFWMRFNALFIGVNLYQIFVHGDLWRILLIALFAFSLKVNYDAYMEFPESERNK